MICWAVQPWRCPSQRRRWQCHCRGGPVVDPHAEWLARWIELNDWLCNDAPAEIDLHEFGEHDEWLNLELKIVETPVATLAGVLVQLLIVQFYDDEEHYAVTEYGRQTEVESATVALEKMTLGEPA